MSGIFLFAELSRLKLSRFGFLDCELIPAQGRDDTSWGSNQSGLAFYNLETKNPGTGPGFIII